MSGTCALDLVHEVPQETFVRVLRSLMTIITVLTMMMKKMMTTIQVMTTITSIMMMMMTILRERLHFVYILTLIMIANLSGTNNLTSFLLSNEDMKQWQVPTNSMQLILVKTLFLNLSQFCSSIFSNSEAMAAANLLNAVYT